MQKSFKKLSSLILALGLAGSAFPAAALEKDTYKAKNSIVDNEIKTEYDEDGSMILELNSDSNIGLIINDGKTEFYDAAGNQAKSSWINIKGKWYFFDQQGIMTKGWLNKESNWYYLDNNGIMKSSQWVNVDGKWYYFNDSGIMLKNTTVDGYKINNNGVGEKV